MPVVPRSTAPESSHVTFLWTQLCWWRTFEDKKCPLHSARRPGSSWFWTSCLQSQIFICASILDMEHLRSSIIIITIACESSYANLKCFVERSFSKTPLRDLRHCRMTVLCLAFLLHTLETSWTSSLPRASKFPNPLWVHWWQRGLYSSHAGGEVKLNTQAAAKIISCVFGRSSYKCHQLFS